MIETMLRNDADIERLQEIETEIARLDREREAAETYGDFGSRPQRLLRRCRELLHERDELMARLNAPRPGTT